MLSTLQHAAAMDKERQAPVGGRIVKLKGPSGRVWSYHIRENREPTQEELSSMSWDVLEREKEAGVRPATAPPAWPQTESKSPIPNSLAETVGAMIAPKAPAKSAAAPRSPEWVAEQAVRKYPKVDASHKALATEYAKSSGATVAQLTKMVGSQQWEAMRSHLAMRPLDPGDPNFVARLLEQQRVIDAAKARQKEARKVTIGPSRAPNAPTFTDTEIDEQMLQSLSPAALEAEVARRKAAHLANPRNTLEREEYTRAFEAAQGRSGLLGMLNIGQVLEDVRITAQSALTREEGSQMEKAAALGQTAFNVGALDAAIGGLVGKVAKAAIARFRRFAKTGDIAAIAREISTLAPAERAAATNAFKDVLPPVGQKARFERGVHEISNSLDIPRGEARQVAKAFRTVAGDYPHNMNGEVKDVMGLMDAAAATWTKNTGRTLEEWNQMFGIDKPARKPIESTSATRGIAQTPEEFIAERWRTRTEAEIAEIDSILSGEKPADVGKKAWRQQQAQARETLRPIRAELQASLESGVPHPTIEKELRAAHELFTPPPKAPVEPPKIEEPTAAVEPPPEPVAAERPGGNGTPPPKTPPEPPPVEEIPRTVTDEQRAAEDFGERARIRDFQKLAEEVGVEAPPAHVESWDQWIQEARDLRDRQDIVNTLKDKRDRKQVLSPAERAAAKMEAIDLRQAMREVQDKMKVAADARDEIAMTELEDQYQKMRHRMADLAGAAMDLGSESGRALASHRMVVSEVFDTYHGDALAMQERLLRHAEQTARRNLTEAERVGVSEKVEALADASDMAVKWRRDRYKAAQTQIEKQLEKIGRTKIKLSDLEGC